VRIRILAIVALAFGANSFPTAGGSSPLHFHAASRMSMGCLYAIEAYAADAERLPAAVEAAFDEVDRIDRLMSHYKEDSALSRVNREAARYPVGVEPELFEFIDEALRYTRESNGAFDITVGPLMRAWGFFRGDGRMPSAAELAAARRLVGARHVKLYPASASIRFDMAGVELDLGGIAKGYAVDRAVALLEHRGVSAALVSAGGSTIHALGAPPGLPGWEVDVQDPVDPLRVARRVRLKDRTLSVAGGSEKAFELDGVRYSHIMDPRIGRPVGGMLSVAVLTSTATEGDALDNAFFVLGPSESRTLLDRRGSTEAFFFLPDGAGGWRVAHEQGTGRAPGGPMPDRAGWRMHRQASGPSR
jgi:thiamine biosynthesis lipoprotein